MPCLDAVPSLSSSIIGRSRVIELIEDTMEPYGGCFLVHGSPVEVVEGEWPGALVMLSFPDMGAARDWYASPAYRRILPLRTGHIAGDVVLVDGVGPGYDARKTAAAMRGGRVSDDHDDAGDTGGRTER